MLLSFLVIFKSWVTVKFSNPQLPVLKFFVCKKCMKKCSSVIHINTFFTMTSIHPLSLDWRNCPIFTITYFFVFAKLMLRLILVPLTLLVVWCLSCVLNMIGSFIIQQLVWKLISLDGIQTIPQIISFAYYLCLSNVSTFTLFIYAELVSLKLLFNNWSVLHVSSATNISLDYLEFWTSMAIFWLDLV